MSSEIYKPAETTFYAAYSDGVAHVGVTEPGQVTTTGQTNLVYSDDPSEFLSISAEVDMPDITPMPEEGEWVSKGIYEFEGVRFAAVQDHTRMHFHPNDTPALFSRTIIDGEIREWRQPTGAHDVYPLGYKVAWIGGVWKSLIAANTTTPEVGSQFWKLVSGEPEEPDAPPAWVQPTGAHDAYPFGYIVTHNGNTWQSTHNGANSWEPGVFGWQPI